MSDASRATRHMLKATDDGDIDDYNKWVSRGADTTGTDKKGQNALHFLVKQGKYRMLQQVLNSQPEVHNLVNKADNKGWSALHLCCIQHPVELRTLESLLTVGGDPYLENKCGKCKDLVDDDAKEFLHWRKRHHNGLPRDIKTLPNEYILLYIRKFGHLGDDFTTTYDRILEEGKVESNDIQIIITGPRGVGKTTLSKSMMGWKAKKSGQTPTKCIEMYPRRFTIDLDDGSRDDNGDEPEIVSCLQQFVDSVLKRTEDQGHPRKQTWLKRHLSVTTRPGKEVSEQNTRGTSEKPTVSVLDFSGNSVYEGIQHMFMTSNCVYILVFSLQLYPRLEEMLVGVHERLRYISLSKNGQHPGVILVGTNLDKVPDSSKNQEAIHAEIREHLKEHTELGKFASEHVQRIFLVNSLELQQEVREEIWQSTVTAATRDHQWRQEVPARWLALERELLRYRANGHKIMTFGNVCLVAKEMAVPIQEEEQVKECLRLLHRKKALLICNQLLSLKSDDPIVLNTRWLISRLVELLAVQQPFVSPDFMECFLEGDSKTETPRNKKMFMATIVQLSLVAEPLPEKTKNKPGHYILPCMLPPVNNQLITSILSQRKKCSTLCFVSNDHFIPSAIRDRLLTICINRFEVLSDLNSREMLLYRHNGCFIMNPGVYLSLQCSKSRMKLTLFSCTDSQIHAGIGNVIRETVVNLFGDRTKYDCRLLYDDVSCEILVPEDGVIRQNTDPFHQNLPEDVAIWFGQSQQMPDIPSIGNSLDPLQDLELNPKRLSHVAKHIWNSYAVVFAALGVETSVVEQERWQHKHLDFRSQLTKILLRWRALKKDAASLQMIVAAMKLNNIPYEEMLLDPILAGETTTTMTKLKDMGASVIPDMDLSSSPSRDDLEVIARIVGSSFLVFFLELDVDYRDIKKAMELHRRQSEKVLTMYLLEVWGQRLGSKATFYCVVRAMEETNLDTSQLKHINPRSSHC
ncbi:uncharacterized protein LOC117316131 [Pecten maximus]|uniref:uncharacterized protein LOC117316131 n=1 Tax=Pecten maximus TaxID=6579 RepID=UPI001458049D|nr:uncharacterized protein LOC117316131 [Pecten maximus]